MLSALEHLASCISGFLISPGSHDEFSIGLAQLGIGLSLPFFNEVGVSSQEIRLGLFELRILFVELVPLVKDFLIFNSVRAGYA